MPVNANFLAARAAERRFRDFVHLGLPAWIVVRRQGSSEPFARVPLLPLTYRHLIWLRLHGSPFIIGGRYDRSDAFRFLWRLSSCYREPDARRASAMKDIATSRFAFLRCWWALGSLRSAVAYFHLAALVRRADLVALGAALVKFVEAAEQDAPGAEIGKTVSAAAPDRCAADNWVNLLMSTYHLKHDEALDTPVALGYQLARERMFDDPDAASLIFAPSDQLL